MKTKFRVLALTMVVAMLFGAAFGLAGCSSDEPEQPAGEPTGSEQPAEQPTDVAEGEATFQEVCTTCHDGDRVFLQPDGTDWSKVIDTMESAHGAVLTTEQKASVQAYLEEYQQSTGEKIISGKCTSCHDMARIYNQTDAAQWESILKKMVEVHGAELTAEEQSAVLDYLNNR